MVFYLNKKVMKSGGTLTAYLVEHRHLMADGLLLFPVSPSSIPDAGDKLIGEWRHTGTLTQKVDGDIQILITDLSVL